MSDLAALVDAATQSDFFTAPRLEGDLERFLASQRERIEQLARRTAAGEFDHVFFIGSGGSWASMYSGKYLLDRLTRVPADVLSGYELAWRDPGRLNRQSLVFLASYSGATEDTLVALRTASARGAHCVALTRQDKSPLALGASEVISYDSTALYTIPLAAVYLYAFELAQATASTRLREVEEARIGLQALPELLGRTYRAAQADGLEQARRFLSAHSLSVLAAGPNFGLGYKFGLTVFMENVRVDGSVIEVSEFRHGPVEALERQRLDVVALLGTDESRELTERVIRVIEGNDGRVLAFDSAMYPGLQPLLAPFVLLVPLQWFTVYSALLRGISDLDERVFMGHRVLAVGADATWP